MRIWLLAMLLPPVVVVSATAAALDLAGAGVVPVGVALTNTWLATAKPDARPPYQLVDVSGLNSSDPSKTVANP